MEGRLGQEQYRPSNDDEMEKNGIKKNELAKNRM